MMIVLIIQGIFILSFLIWGNKYIDWLIRRQMRKYYGSYPRREPKK